MRMRHGWFTPKRLCLGFGSIILVAGVGFLWSWLAGDDDYRHWLKIDVYRQADCILMRNQEAYELVDVVATINPTPDGKDNYTAKAKRIDPAAYQRFEYENFVRSNGERFDLAKYKPMRILIRCKGDVFRELLADSRKALGTPNGRTEDLKECELEGSWD